MWLLIGQLIYVIPSVALYISIVVTVVSQWSTFKSSFFQFYIFDFFINIFTLLNTFYVFRLANNTCDTCLLATVFQNIDEFINSSFMYAMQYHMAYVQYLSIFITSLNRLTVIRNYVYYEPLWKSYSWVVIIAIIVLPTPNTIWVMSFGARWDYEETDSNYVLRSPIKQSSIVRFLLPFMVVSIIVSLSLNVASMTVVHQVSQQGRRLVEANFLKVIVITCAVQLVGTVLPILLALAPIPSVFFTVVLYSVPFVSDGLTLCHPWLLFFLSKPIRNSLLRVIQPNFQPTSTGPYAVVAFSKIYCHHLQNVALIHSLACPKAHLEYFFSSKRNVVKVPYENSWTFLTLVDSVLVDFDMWLLIGQLIYVIPSVALYTSIVVTVVSQWSTFKSSFFQFYIFDFFINIFTLLNTFYVLRLATNTCDTCLLATVFQNIDEFVNSSFMYAMQYHMAYVQYLSIFITSLNRLTVIRNYVYYEPLWTSYSWVVIIAIIVLPTPNTIWVMSFGARWVYEKTESNYVLRSTIDQSSIARLILPFMVVSIVVSLILNVASMLMVHWRSRQGKRLLETNFLKVIVITCAVQLVGTVLPIIALGPIPPVFITILRYSVPFISDGLTLCHPWLLFFLSKPVRNSLLKVIKRKLKSTSCAPVRETRMEAPRN